MVEPGKYTTTLEGARFGFGRGNACVKIGAGRQDLQPGICGGDSLRGRHQMRPRDVHGNVGGEIREPVEEQPGLGAGTASQLDQQRVRADPRRDFLCVPLRESEFPCG